MNKVQLCRGYRSPYGRDHPEYLGRWRGGCLFSLGQLGGFTLAHWSDLVTDGRECGRATPGWLATHGPSVPSAACARLALDGWHMCRVCWVSLVLLEQR